MNLRVRVSGRASLHYCVDRLNVMAVAILLLLLLLLLQVDVEFPWLLP